jgi:hypothetical protein
LHLDFPRPANIWNIFAVVNTTHKTFVTIITGQIPANKFPWTVPRYYLMNLSFCCCRSSCWYGIRVLFTESNKWLKGKHVMHGDVLFNLVRLLLKVTTMTEFLLNLFCTISFLRGI